MNQNKYNLQEDNPELYEKLKEQHSYLKSRVMVIDKNALNIRQKNDNIDKVLLKTEILIELIRKYKTI